MKPAGLGERFAWGRACAGKTAVAAAKAKSGIEIAGGGHPGDAACSQLAEALRPGDGLSPGLGRIFHDFVAAALAKKLAAGGSLVQRTWTMRMSSMNPG